jgi:cell division protease FtsH
MSDALGPVNYNGHERRSMFLETGGMERGIYAEHTAQQIDAEVRRIMSDAHDEATRLLTEQRATLERVTLRLLEKEVLEQDEFLALYSGEPLPPVDAPAQLAPSGGGTETGGNGHSSTGNLA